MEVSLRRFAAAPERGVPDGVEVLADSDVASVVEEGSAGGWLAASGRCEVHPETTVRMATAKASKTANSRGPISRVGCAARSIRELHCWPNCCRGVAAFTGGP